MTRPTRTAAAILCALLPCLGGAETYSFKRIKVGESQPGKRITVQIDPEEQARYLASLPKVDPHPKPSAPLPPVGPDAAGTTAAGKPRPAPASSYAWFWDKVPAGIAEASGRFDLALAALGQGPGGTVVGAPRMQHLQAVADRYGKDILRATLDTRVSPALVLAVIGIESAGRPEAVSHAGAVGLMQLIPATAKRYGVSDSKDPV